jgi:hypothetical protein
MEKMRKVYLMIAFLALVSCKGGNEPDAGLVCDAVYVPVVTFDFIIADTGEQYCGPAEISYSGEYNSEEYGPYNQSCICINGEMRNLYDDYHPCHVDPYGHASIKVEVEGYETFTTEVDVPYECHPRIPVRVELQPI